MNWKAFAAILVAIGITFATWWHFAPSATAPVGTTAVAPSDKRVAKVPTETVAVPKLKVYVPAAKGSLSLPPSIQANPEEQVVEAVTISSSPRPQTAITVTNTGTGESQTLVQKAEYPLIAAEQTGEVRLAYGLRSNGRSAWHLTAHEDLVQIKGLHCGIEGSLLNDGTAFVGTGIAWKW